MGRSLTSNPVGRTFRAKHFLPVGLVKNLTFFFVPVAGCCTVKLSTPLCDKSARATFGACMGACENIGTPLSNFLRKTPPTTTTHLAKASTMADIPLPVWWLLPPLELGDSRRAQGDEEAALAAARLKRGGGGSMPPSPPIRLGRPPPTLFLAVMPIETRCSLARDLALRCLAFRSLFDSPSPIAASSAAAADDEEDEEDEEAKEERPPPQKPNIGGA
jgi:hypothetical protein